MTVRIRLRRLVAVAVCAAVAALGGGLTTTAAAAVTPHALVRISPNFVIINNNSELCLSVPGASTVPGTYVDQWPCGDNESLYFPDQVWYKAADPAEPENSDGYYYIVNYNSGLCLSVPGASTVPGVRANLWPCGGFPDQAWYIPDTGLVWNYNSGLVLSVPGASTVPGDPVNQWVFGPYPDQFWGFYDI